jgi:uncharacterized protein (TIGR03118 family)
MFRSLQRASMFVTAIFAFATLVYTSALAQHFTRVDLTVDAANVSPTAPNLDPNLVNAWGLTRASGSPWWISDNGTGVSTLYDGTGAAQPAGQPLVVTIPLPKGQQGTSAPTGTVFNPTLAFEVAPKMKAIFLFVTEDGTISGWNPQVEPTTAVIKVNRSKKAVYKGCALVQTDDGPRLYASNFKTGRVEVFDGRFGRVRTEEWAFRFPGLSTKRWAPFNVQNVGGNLVVTFANRDAGSKDENHGPGLGFVGVFSPKGRLLLRLQHGSFLNAPWGVALAPSDFGVFSHRFLIGNFGDGTIHAFNAVTGRFEGTMLGDDNTKVEIPGLWAISFASGNPKSGAATDLYFTAGPNDENNGLFGKLSPAPNEQRGSTE